LFPITQNRDDWRQLCIALLVALTKGVILMTTLKQRIEEYLRINSQEDDEVASAVEEEEYRREREKIDLQKAQESLAKLKRLSYK
jgi:hypothetical protein